MISNELGFEGRTARLCVEAIIRQYGDAGRYGVASNSRVSAANARRLVWSPKGPSLVEHFEDIKRL